MLIYVRDAERQDIIGDQLQIDKQIPINMQIHFKNENFLRLRIENDTEIVNSNDYGKVYLISEEILENYEWNGQFLGKSSSNNYQFAEKHKFYQDKNTHLMIYVNKLVRIN